jgi:Flp pilus assembly protein TadD
LGTRDYLHQGSFNQSGQSQFIHANLVIALQRLGKGQEALLVANHFLAGKVKMTAQTRSNVLVNKGNIYADRGQFKQSEKFYRQALQVYAENIAAMSNLAGILTMRGQFDEAEILVNKVLMRNIEDKEANMILNAIKKAKAQ